MKLTHSIIKKHRGPKRSKLLLSTLCDVKSIESFCKNIDANRTIYSNYESTPEQSSNCWAGDMMELLMEAWFQYSNTINTFHVAKPNEIPRPIVINNYRIIDRDGNVDEEDHGVDAYADTDTEGGITIQHKFRQRRNNLTRNQLATFIIESMNPKYNAENGRRLVITTGEGTGGMGKGIISNITKFFGFDDIYYVNRFLLSEHMDGTTFWDDFYSYMEHLLFTCKQ